MLNENDRLLSRDEAAKFLGVTKGTLEVWACTKRYDLPYIKVPYGYYTFMRFIVCGCSAYIAYNLYHNNDRNAWLWIFGIIAILFNPIAPIHMTKEIWMIVDALIGGLFLWLGYKKFKVGQ